MSTGKKVRRVRRPQTGPNRTTNEPLAQPLTLTATPKTAPPPKKSSSTEEELREEYTYVLQDLRRVFLLAAAMFILLILINLFLL
jgi:hypothetical protein